MICFVTKQAGNTRLSVVGIVGARRRNHLVEINSPGERSKKKGGNGIRGLVGFSMIIRGSPNLVRSAPRSPTHFFFFFQSLVHVHDDDAAANALFQARHVTEGTSSYYLYVRSDASFLFLFVPALLTRRIHKSFVICQCAQLFVLF